MLKGNSINLRPMLIEDINYLTKWFADNPLAIDFLGSNFTSIEKVKEYFEAGLKNSFIRKDFIIETKEGKVIGTSSLENINWRHRSAESVNFIGERGYRKKKYIIEAHLRIFDYSFEFLNLHRIQWRILESNPRMLNILENWIKTTRCNESSAKVYSLEGILQECYYTHGRFHNLRIYGILKNNYLKQKKNLHRCFKEGILSS